MENLRFKFRAWSNKYQKMFRVSEIRIDRDGYVHGLVDAETKNEFQPTQEEFETNPYVWIGRVDFIKSTDGRVSGISQSPEEEAFILLQYTGLKDRNGKEIYEGDVLEAEHKLKTQKFKRKYQVIFNEKGYWDAISLDDKPVRLCYAGFNKCEIISNIYENPHLLGGEINGI